MGAAQVSRADDGTQVVGVFYPIAQHQKRCFAFGLSSGKQILQRGILHLGGAGGHALVVVGTADLLQLMAGYPFDHRAGLLGQGGVIAGNRLRQRVCQIDSVHRAAAFQQLGHGIFAPYQRVGARFSLLAGNLFHRVPPAGHCPGNCRKMHQR